MFKKTSFLTIMHKNKLYFCHFIVIKSITSTMFMNEMRIQMVSNLLSS